MAQANLPTFRRSFIKSLTSFSVGGNPEMIISPASALPLTTEILPDLPGSSVSLSKRKLTFLAPVDNG
ncbi:MAG: hypothetical protein ABIN80_05545 [Dyadobacter sp.]|uniref:hypothetical protein n=1 Tax=Dyadobacter sp. TaxID=1914288 RepID=UPI00326559A0